MTTQNPPVLVAMTPEQRPPSFFGVLPEGRLRRRLSDLVQLVAAVLLVVACVVVTDGFSSGTDDVYGWLSELPSWLTTTAAWLFVLSTIGAVVVVAAALFATGSPRLALTIVAVGVLASLVTTWLANEIDVVELRDSAGDVQGPLTANSVVWLAVAAAVLLAVAPYLVRPARRLVWSSLAVAVLSGVLAAVGPLGPIVAAVAAGWAMSALASLVFGTPNATPTTAAVAAALDELGVVIEGLALADSQTWGETRFVGHTRDHAPVSVVVISRDGSDAKFLSKLWRTLVYRDAGPSISASRSAQLEHRAYMVLMAAKVGVPVSDVVITASGGRDDLALLALVDPDGRRLADLDGDEVADEILDAAWAALARLHDARLAHGLIGPANLVVGADGSIGFVDFSRGSPAAPTERCVRDRVDLLASTAGLVGDDPALAAALRALGDDGLGELLQLLQTAALSPAARAALPDAGKRLKALRQAGAELTEREVPKLTELHRVSAGNVVMAAMTFFGFYLIVAQFEGVDIAATMADAEWSWVLVVMALSFVPQFSGSVALMGAVSKPLPFGPVLAEQFANNFTGLIGGTTATTALVIRFFQKQGLKVAVAASSGVMNSVAGAVVQIVLVVVGLLVSDTSFVPSATGGGGGGQLILAGIVIVGVGVTIAMLFPKCRAAVKTSVGPQLAAAKDNLRGILTTPRKAVMIFGGNVCSQLAYALVLGAALKAFGASLPLADLVIINSLASLVGGVAPVPGGMGVIEAGLIGGMTAAGVDESVAVAATFTARLFTTYLPPIWGWFALRWLHGHDYA